MASRLSRRRFLALLGATVASSVMSVSHAQDQRRALRVGTVFPARSGESIVYASVNDITGEASRMGAILADDRFGAALAREGLDLETLLASSPSAAAATRAAQRLVAVEEVHALVGGVGVGQAEAIADVAAAAGIPFLNVGSSDDGLRRRSCSEPIYHLEASGAMFVDAMVADGARHGPRRWCIVHETTERGTRLGARAAEAVARFDPSGDLVGTIAVAPEQPVYVMDVLELEQTGADAVLLLIEARDQIAFLGQQEDLGVDVETFAFPEGLSQTRDYFAAARFNVPLLAPRRRFSTWDVTLTDHGAADFNDTFTARWGEVANPTAWATHTATRVLTAATVLADEPAPDALRAALDDPSLTIDAYKGVPLSFRTWDRQLRQPLYVVDVDPDAVYDRMSLSSRIGLASVTAALPDLAALGNDEDAVRAALDAFGDGPEVCS